jgi:hypothetical protein
MNQIATDGRGKKKSPQSRIEAYEQKTEEENH